MMLLLRIILEVFLLADNSNDFIKDVASPIRKKKQSDHPSLDVTVNDVNEEEEDE